MKVICVSREREKHISIFYSKFRLGETEREIERKRDRKRDTERETETEKAREKDRGLKQAEFWSERNRMDLSNIKCNL